MLARQPKRTGLTSQPPPTDARFKNLTGQDFDRWHVLRYAGKAHGNQHYYWCECRCSPGIERLVLGSRMVAKRSRSCGCHRSEVTSSRFTTHGMTETKEYRTWGHIHTRCTNQDDPNYPKYGGAGITIDPSWDSFEQFYADMGPAPGPEYSIDRIDTTGNYTPANTRWATPTTQARNRRCVKSYTYDGKTLTLPEWEELTDLDAETYRLRLKKGWSVERTFGTPNLRPRRD